jgi:hypothetical protein
MMAVRSPAGRIIARKADRGATSMDCVQERRTRNMIDQCTSFGIGIAARNTDDGRCVKAIVYTCQMSGLSRCEQFLEAGLTLTFPNRLASDDATIVEAAAIMPVVKKMDPNFSSGRL